MLETHNKATIQFAGDDVFVGVSPSGHAQVVETNSQRSIAATPMTGWGPSGDRYVRLVFANEPLERLGDLRARFEAAWS